MSTRRWARLMTPSGSWGPTLQKTGAGGMQPTTRPRCVMSAWKKRWSTWRTAFTSTALSMVSWASRRVDALLVSSQLCSHAVTSSSTSALFFRASTAGMWSTASCCSTESLRIIAKKTSTRKARPLPCLPSIPGDSRINWWSRGDPKSWLIASRILSWCHTRPIISLRDVFIGPSTLSSSGSRRPGSPSLPKRDHRRYRNRSAKQPGHG
mmetsp:Transcript_80673/g.193474  ORF Transcript_80673/g.193474 Transcript_80673/m.193474 type:complete len:209 (+) Transcript_80673:987-1613(+)